MSSIEFPALPFAEWEATCDTLHMWTQIVGKTRMALTPMENHWWNATLYVTPRGLTTSRIPFGSQTFDIEFDFLAHKLSIRTSGGAGRAIELFPRSVADFYAEYMSHLHSLGIEVSFSLEPCEFDDPTPFDKDTHHASYDLEHVDRFRRALIGADRVLRRFRAHYLGKASQVHFFWGSFDLAVTRFSGRPAPARPEADHVEREAYSHEQSSCGFWPGDRRFPHPAFYAYTYPKPEGIENQPVRPAQAYWDTKLGEFLLKYEDVRSAAAPEEAILDFCQSAYEAGAKLAHWDRATLERGETTGHAK